MPCAICFRKVISCQFGFLRRKNPFSYQYQLKEGINHASENSVYPQNRQFVKNSRLYTGFANAKCAFVLLLLAFLAWNAQPTDAIIGAVEDGLIAYWSFDKDTVKIKTEAVDILSGLAAAVHGDPELAPASDCKVGECILFDGSVDRFLVEDSNPPKIDRDWEEITLECWVYINALDDSWNRIISLDDMPANTAVASLYYDDDDNQHGFFVRGRWQINCGSTRQCTRGYPT